MQDSEDADAPPLRPRGACASCGFLGSGDVSPIGIVSPIHEVTLAHRVRPSIMITWSGDRHYPGFECALLQYQIANEIRQRFSGLMNEPLRSGQSRESPSQLMTESATAVLYEERDCPAWYEYVQTRDPTQHIAAREAARLEEGRRRYEERLEAARRRFDIILVAFIGLISLATFAVSLIALLTR